MLEQVMEPFFTTKDVGKGTGLGLSMVYGFAKQSGGAFRISSTVGVGTRAELWLPRGTRTAAPAAKPDEEGADPSQGRVLKILVVDDHEGVRTTTAALLSDLGHEVVEAADGGEVMALLDGGANGFDLLITDYAMPHMSGAEVIRQARGVCPALPAIIITGYADSQSIARRPDDVAVLAKPFTPDQVLAAVDAALAESGAPVVLKAAS
jgi:CheY-like chemotaxis protein